MKQTLMSLVESSITPVMDTQTKNNIIYSKFDSIDEDAKAVFGFSPQKVLFVRKPNSINEYLVEFSNNLERCARDNRWTINDAMAEACRVNGVDMEDCTLVFDESANTKVNYEALLRTNPIYKIARV